MKSVSLRMILKWRFLEEKNEKTGLIMYTRQINQIILISIIFLLWFIPPFSKNCLSLQILPSDNLYNYSLRIVREINFGLLPGRFYTPEELVQKGCTLEEITLDEIIAPEEVNHYLETFKEWYKEIYEEEIG